MGDDGPVTNPRNTGPEPTSPPDATASRWSALRPKRGLLAATVLAVAAIDQISKIVAVDALEGKAPVDLLGEWFQLTLLRNPGAAFSMGTGSTWLFTTIQIVFIVAVAVGSKWLRTPWPTISAGLIAGGAAGNLIDRLFRDPSFYFGHVVDFLSVRGFAVFNLADSAITVGVIMLAAWIMFSPDVDEMTGDAKKETKREDAQTKTKREGAGEETADA
ncbi:signal peptidase II [Corynebacterium xerosis]|uniref:Lipoprotein signal peptidase n=1 Tax=Corynebacterium xerosis TaxID=1725 RepID=A0A6B8TQJ2_9CORY|nr:signal peptidase II [Corynebacterium xerosis]